MNRNRNWAIRNAGAAPRKWRKGTVQQGVSSLLHDLLQLSNTGSAKRGGCCLFRKSVLVVSFGRWHSLMVNNTGFLASALLVFYLLDEWMGL